MEQPEHPPEDVSWVQPAESLAFSVSPGGSAGSNTHNGGDTDRKSYGCGSQDGDEREDEEDPPLMGEYIWADSEAGGGDGGNGLNDERNEVTEASQIPVNNDGHESTSSPPSDLIAQRDDGSRDLPPNAQQGSWGEQQQQYRDDNDIDEAGGALALLLGEGGDEDQAIYNGDLAAEASRRGSEARSQLRGYEAVDLFVRQDRNDEDRDDNGAAWADNDHDDDDGGIGEDYAPAWDQGRPAESSGRNIDADLEDAKQISRPNSSRGEESVVAPRIQDRRQVHEAIDCLRFESAQEEDSSTSIRSGSSSSAGGENVHALADSRTTVSRGRQDSPPFFGAVPRRTRRSVDRERRRLDRVPRSKRLSQVKGHPLGGMTLLELEERRLLDVGIGQMARQLAKHEVWRSRSGDGGVRQSNEDLLRRSARLLRRAQEERDARFSVDSERDFYHSSRSSGGGVPSSRPSRHASDGVGGTRQRPSATERSEGGQRKSRRPASASRSHSRHSMSSSFAAGPTDRTARDRGYSTSDYSRPDHTDTWKGAREGDAPPVGLYSGGGARCSLKQRRPMSAKPALTCGSGWEPGRVGSGCRRDKTRRNGGGSGARWDHFEVGDARGTPFPGGERQASVALGGLGGEDGVSNCSDVSDLSPQGIVDYTDDEEGPFNVDELERVAASYLLRPRGSTCFSSAAVNDEDDEDDLGDNRFADDGSVYIYREGDGSPLPSERAQRQEENEVHINGDGGDSQEFDGDGVHNRGSSFTPQRVKDGVRTHRVNGCKLWQDERSKKHEGNRRSSYSCNGSGPSGENNRGMSIPCAENRPFLRQHGGHGDRDSIRAGGVADGLNSNTMREPHADCHSLHRKTNQVITNSLDRNSPLEVVRVDDLSGATSDEGGNDSGPNRGGVGSFDNSTPQPDRAYCEERPPERFALPVPGACYSAKVGKDLQGRGWHDRSTVPARRQAGRALEPSAKARQTAACLRNMILDRQASANRSIREVFRHFDRRRCGYVNVAEMREALADLRINLSPDEAKELHSMIALDGGDRLSFAEFVVFVTDPHHSELQEKVCRQAAEQLEALGRRSFSLDAAFRPAAAQLNAVDGGASLSGVGGQTWPETTRMEESRRQLQNRGFGETMTTKRSNDTVDSLQGQAGGAVAVNQLHSASSGGGPGGGGGGEKHDVSAAQFLAGLRSLGLSLSVSDAHRLILRFDVHGDGHLSTRRFLSMVERSCPWTQALTRLAHQEEADEEADACLRAQKKYGEWPPPVEQRPWQDRGQGQDQTLVLNTDIVEMARYIGIRVSSDSSLLWIAADALAAPLPNGWVMHQGEEGQWFYHNEITGQSRWDHPLDPHFRDIYLQGRFGRDAQGSTETPVLGGERSPGALQEGADSTAVRVARSDGPTEGRANFSPVQSGRPPLMLPPCRMRPNVADFPTDKALENLRARRLNAGGSHGGGLTFEAETATAATTTATMVTRSAHTPHAHANPVTSSNCNRFHRSMGELWADGRGRNSNGTPAGPAGPGRRRPVSASAVREGLEERSLGLRVQATEITPPGRVKGGRGGSSGSTGALSFERSRIGDSQRDQRVRNGGDGVSGVATVTKRTRRPSSAKAALQRPPTPAVSDYHRYQPHSNDRGRVSRERYSSTDGGEQQQAEIEARNARHYRQMSSTSLPVTDEKWVREVGNSACEVSAGPSTKGSGTGGGRERGGVQSHCLREDGKRIGEPTPVVDVKEISTWPVGIPQAAEAQHYVPDEEERAWLRSRLVDLCGKLNEVEAFVSKGEQQGLQQRYSQQQCRRIGTDDPVADHHRAPGVERRGLGGRGGRSSSRQYGPPRQPDPFEDIGSRLASRDSHEGRLSPAASGDEEEVLSYEEIGNGRPSSGGDGDNPKTNNNMTSHHNTIESSRSILRDQILELNDRMRYLEERLLRRRDLPSSPKRLHCEENDINLEGEVQEQFPSPRQPHLYQHRGHQEDRRRGAAVTSLLTTGTTLPTVAGQLFVPGVGPKHGGSRGGLKQGSQDDLAYHPPERMEGASVLSKKSWPPSTRSSAAVAAAASVGAAVHAGSSKSGGSSNSSSSYGDPSHAFAMGGKLTRTSPHLHTWEGRSNAVAVRVVGAGGRRNSGGRAGDVERARSGARRSKSGGRNRNGNPPGIVLI